LKPAKAPTETEDEVILAARTPPTYPNRAPSAVGIARLLVPLAMIAPVPVETVVHDSTLLPSVVDRKSVV
jgi:hypothetical protein